MRKRLKIGISLSGFDADGKFLSLLNDSGYEIVKSNIPLKELDEIADFFADCEVLIAGSEPLNQLIEESEKLKLILRAGVGTDNFSISLCKAKNISWIVTESQVASSVSNYVLGNILLISSGLYQNQITKPLTWRNELPKGLDKSTVGIIGLGRIGLSLLDKLLQFPILRVLINDTSDLDLHQLVPNEHRERVQQVDLETCLSNSDIVSLHLPLTSGTRNLINTDKLSIIPKKSWLINTSRGEIVDEVALYDSLISHNLGGVVLDVFTQEPYSGPLIGVPNAILTPHIGTYNLHTRNTMESFLVSKAIDFLLEFNDTEGVGSR